MLTLLVMRHAKAEQREGIADRDRALTKRGRTDADGVGAEIALRGTMSGVVLCSSAKRAVSTARRVVRSLPAEVDLRVCDELYGATHEQCLACLRQVETARVVLIVGHNPGLETLAATLTGKAVPLATGAVARLDLQISTWDELDARSAAELCWVLTPSSGR